MNKRHIITGLLVCALCLVAVWLKPELLATAFVFIFMGVVPNSNMTIPSWATLSVMVVLLALAVVWLFDQPTYHPVATPQDLARRSRARRKVLSQAKSRPVRKLRTATKTVRAKA